METEGGQWPRCDAKGVYANMSRCRHWPSMEYIDWTRVEANVGIPGLEKARASGIIESSRIGDADGRQGWHGGNRGSGAKAGICEMRKPEYG